MARTHKPLIIFDSFVRFHKRDENLAADMAPVMGHLREIANAGAPVMAIHHRAKNESSRFRGSSDILAAVDFAYSLHREGEKGFLHLKCFKNRLGEEFQLCLQPDLSGSGDIKVVESGEKQKLADDFRKLSEIVEKEPGINQKALIKKSGMPQKRCVSILKKGDGTNWRTKQGDKNSILYFPIGDFALIDD